MEERSINRGEVWWVSVDDSIGGEQQTGRPALILSTKGASDIHNTYTVAYMTKGGFASPVMPSVIISGVKHRVLCNQLRTLDSSRFTNRMTTLSSADIARINGALASALGLRAPEKQDLEVEVKSESEELAALRVDAAMYKMMYEKVLNQLVDLRIEMDMAKRVVVASEVIAEPEPEEVVEEVVEEEPPVEPPRILKKDVDLNTCTLDDLRGIGVNEDVAIRLIEGRPWKKVEDIRRVDGLTTMMYAVLSKVVKVTEVTVEEPPVVAVKEQEMPEYTWGEFKKLSETEQKRYLDYHRSELGEIEREIAEGLGVKPSAFSAYVIDHGLGSNGAGPKKQKQPEPSTVAFEIEPSVKLNINTASANDLMEKLGMKRDYAYAITGHRNKYGLFEDIEELLLVKRFYKPAYERYKDHLTVTDEVAEEPPKPKMGMKITSAPVVKYNINKASAYELQQAGFNKTQAHLIVHSRKNKGPFYDIDDLLDVESIRKKDIRKLRDVLEV